MLLPKDLMKDLEKGAHRIKEVLAIRLKKSTERVVISGGSSLDQMSQWQNSAMQNIIYSKNGFAMSQYGQSQLGVSRW